jgi:DNA-binding CsgD family transcriptional regulator
VAPSAARSGALGRIERICSSGEDARTLRLRLLGEIRRTVAFDFHVWALTDPETAVGAAPLAAVPDLSEVPWLIRGRYLTALNRWTTLTDGPVATLVAATDGELERSLVWRELLARHAVTDVASVVFRDAFGCWAFLELWRTAGPFSATDTGFLRDTAVPVTAALRAALARTFSTAPSGPRLAGPVVLVLSPDLEVRGQTPGTDAPLRLMVPRDDLGPPVPAGAYNVAAQLLAREAGVDDHPAEARAHVGGGRWSTLRAARLDGPLPAHHRDIAVTIEESTPAERLSLFARATGLSPRERELLGLLAVGHDTAEVAARMHLSAYTVQDHLKSVFAKADARSRRELLSRVLGS